MFHVPLGAGLLLWGVVHAAAQPAPANNTVRNEIISPGLVVGAFGSHVQDSDGADAGRLWDVLFDADGRPRAAVIQYGGTLGVGQRKIAIAWQMLHFIPTDRAHPVHLALTLKQLGAIPEFKNGTGAIVIGTGR